MRTRKQRLIDQAFAVYKPDFFHSFDLSQTSLNSSRYQTPDPKPNEKRKNRFQTPTPKKRAQFSPISPSESFKINLDEISPPPSRLPYTLKLIEQYFTEIWVTIRSKYPLSKFTLSRASNMLKILEETSNKIPNLSLLFYDLVESVLMKLEEMEFEEEVDCKELADHLLELACIIEEGKFLSDEYPMYKYENLFNKKETLTLEDLKNLVEEKVKMVTVNLFNLLLRIKNTDFLLENVFKAYLMLMSGIDRSIELKNCDILGAIKEFASVPGKAVQTTRKILHYIDHNRIHPKLFEACGKLIRNINYNRLKAQDRIGIGLILYELSYYSVQYHKKLVLSEIGFKKRLHNKTQSNFSFTQFLSFS